MVSRCEPPVVDLGCGPGRMVVALNRSGRSALGVDMSAVAVDASMTRGGLALHRRISDPLPAEGRWGTALLVDSNIGMGGDLEALLSRCRDLIGAGGLVICEVDPAPDRDEVHQVVLSSDRLTSAPLPWGRIGARTLARVAGTAGPAGDRGVVSRRPGLRHPAEEPAPMSIARPRQWPRFSSTLRSTAVTARVGRVLGIAIGICFLTGLLSHYQYAALGVAARAGQPDLGLPRHPGPARRRRDRHASRWCCSSCGRSTRTCSGGRRSGRSSMRSSAVTVAILVASTLVQLTTGFLNALNWYPFPWYFPPVHRFLGVRRGRLDPAAHRGEAARHRLRPADQGRRR